MTMTAVTFAATIDRILNGLTRPFFGWISDRSAARTPCSSPSASKASASGRCTCSGHDPVWFVILSGLVFFAWGEIYSLFPSTCTDTFGAKFATTNAGLLYTAKGTAALLVPVANYMQQSSGSWDRVFLIAAGANILASLLAIAGAQAVAQGRGCARRPRSLAPIHSIRRAPGLQGRAFLFAKTGCSTARRVGTADSLAFRVELRAQVAATAAANSILHSGI